MRFGAEHRPHLVHALEDPDQLLLVELRALRQVRRAPEVVDGEDVGARLRGRLDELRGRHLGEAEPVQGGPEAAQRRGGQLPPGALGRVSPQHRRVVEQRRQRDVEGRPPQLGRRRLGRLGQRLDHRVGHLHATGGLRVGSGGAGDPHRRLLGRDGCAGRKHDLGESAAVPQDEEGDPRQLAAPVHPALEGDPGAGRRCGQVVAERSHEVPPGCAGPWRCGRGQGRGATTPSPVSAGLSSVTPDARTAAALLVCRRGVRPRGRRDDGAAGTAVEATGLSGRATKRRSGRPDRHTSALSGRRGSGWCGA